MRGHLARILCVGLPAMFLGVFFVYPVVSILGLGLSDGGIKHLTGLPANATFRAIAWFTLWQAVASTVLAVVMALPAAHLIARRNFSGRRLLRAATTVPFVLPTVVVGGAFLVLFDRFGLNGGPVRVTHTVWAVLIAHVFFNVAVVVRTVGSFWEGMDPAVEEQARVLGASQLRTFGLVTLPRLWPAIASAASIVFLFCLTSFGVILLLGGPGIATLETEIWRHAVWRGDFRAATALAIVQLVAVIAVVAVSNRLQHRRAMGQRTVLHRAPTAGRLELVANLGLLGVVLGLPVVVLIEQSFSSGSGYSIGNYRALAERVNLLPVTALEALGNSLVFAVVAVLLAVTVGGLASLVVVHGPRVLSRTFDLGLMVPLGASAVTIGFGMLIALDQPPLDLRSSRWLVPVAHALIGIPFVMRTLVPTLRSIDSRLREVAAVLGAPPRLVRRLVDLPIAGRALAVGAGFAFAVSLGEFGATSFLPRQPDRLTAPLALFRLLGTPGQALRGQAMALAVVLMVLTALSVLLIESRRESMGGEL